MPVRGSNRGTRARPASTTMRTPSTVSDDSAMSVLSTTRRRPAGDGRSARSWSASGSAPASGRTSTWSGSASLSSASTRRISPMPGRNASTSPGSSRSARAIRSAIACSVRACFGGGAQRSSTGCIRPSLATTGQPSSSVVQLGDVRASPTSRAARGRGGGAGARRARGRDRGRSAGCARAPRRTRSPRRPGSSGSFCRRRVSTPSVTTSTRVRGPIRRSSRVW